MSKFYAVKKGRKTGVFLTWEQCEKQVKGYSGALYKSFSTSQDAHDYLKQKEQTICQDGLLAYVDGSYNIKTKEYGYGCVLLHGQEVIQKLYGKGCEESYASMRNVAGEIIGSEVAIRYAIEQQWTSICIYYDYEGIEKWALGQWKATKPGTQAYQKFIQSCRDDIDISFVKVLAHSGDVYNDMADMLAKKSVGIA